MLWIRSTLFYLGLVGSTLVMGVLGLGTVMFPERARYRFLTQWGRFNLWWLKLTCGVHWTVQGREHLPAGPAVVLSKHQSAWETFAFAHIFPIQSWVLKRELLRIPLFGWCLALLRPVAIDRKAGRRAINQVLEQGAQRLGDGRWVVIFPEGTRVTPGQKGRYGVSGALLAERTGHPVVPVAHNAGECWPRNGWLKYPGTVRVVIGPPILPTGRSAQEVNRLAEEWIEQQMTRINGTAGGKPTVVAPSTSSSS